MIEFIDAKLLLRVAARGIRYGFIGKRLVLLAGIVGAWWFFSLILPHYILFGPLCVYEAFKLIHNNGDLWANLGITLGRVGVGFTLAVLVSVPFGIALGAVHKFGEFFEPVLSVLNIVSSVIWAIFAIIWFGIFNAIIIFVVFMIAMLFIIINVWQGTRSVNADFIELVHTLRMLGWKVMIKIYLFTILLYFFSGARFAFGFGWCVSLVVEMLGVSSGVGYRLRQAADLIQTDQVFAWIIIMIAMMVVLEMGAFKLFENHLFRWKKEAES